MSGIKNVAVVGASGLVGKPITKALIDSGKFSVTIITREGSKSTFPEGAKVISADFSSVDSLKSALDGQDAVVSAVGTEGLQGQATLIDAAIAAGVKRFLPSEYGCDLEHQKAAALPVFGYKVAIEKKLTEVAAASSNFTYTFLYTGPFLDWGLAFPWLFNFKEDQPAIYDNGTTVFSSTSLPSVGQAVVSILNHPEETKNRSVRVRDLNITQNKIYEIAQKVAPEKKWQPKAVDTAELEKASNESLKQGIVNMGVMFGYLNRAIFASGYGSKFEKDDNELLGIRGKTESDVEAYLREAIKGQ